MLLIIYILFKRAHILILKLFYSSGCTNFVPQRILIQIIVPGIFQTTIGT